ncbi:MAG: hypothetical protein AAFY63_18805 [Cyanobacteria bacterium J06643_13]
MNFEFLFNPKLSDRKAKNAVPNQTQVASEPRINRVLRWFEKEGDSLVGEIVVNNINIEHLQKLFKVDSKNPMYDCYLVETSEQINYLESLLNFKLDTDSYEYLIECDLVKSN